MLVLVIAAGVGAAYVLAGRVLKPLQQITSEPIPDASFLDNVKAGTRFVYAVRAVDKAGNVSLYSERIEETAR